MPKILPLRQYEQGRAKSKDHIILLVDCSGSMHSFEKETRETIFSIIEELDNNKHLTLVFFDDCRYNIVCDDLISNICPELAYTYKTYGGTPITDSLYKSIQDITTQISGLEQLNENHKFILFTDGYENASTYVKDHDLGRAVEHFTDNFNWKFEFIGPKSQEIGIKQYTDRIKIKSENVTLYSDISEGLKEMKESVIA